MALPEVCVVYLMRTGASGLEVLLGDKRTGLGRGKIVGIGGKLDRDETPRHAAVREVFEEIGVQVEASDLREAGVIDYHFPTRPAWSQRSTVFVCRRWLGEPVETDEITPRWYTLADVPYARMWDDAARWLPGVLRGGTVDARFTFGPDLSTVVLEAS
ncbi:8-oxo-dGTP diphosphatase [Microbacterium sulfonylureivorans]|uniref:8-oxo-dGTP diphosphatase n=1 Tax=Microbacterium sulfonylureivorans TaxID=2486854 RepID=UPI0013DF3058|nr:8-oxo-dGTP diphosphatase [Microbacterium sulfonylureivorans]